MTRIGSTNTMRLMSASGMAIKRILVINLIQILRAEADRLRGVIRIWNTMRKLVKRCVQFIQSQVSRLVLIKNATLSLMMNLSRLLSRVTHRIYLITRCVLNKCTRKRLKTKPIVKFIGFPLLKVSSRLARFHQVQAKIQAVIKSW